MPAWFGYPAFKEPLLPYRDLLLRVNFDWSEYLAVYRILCIISDKCLIISLILLILIYENNKKEHHENQIKSKKNRLYARHYKT
jgi:hypothetical protein